MSKRICLVVGHGGKDVGACNPNTGDNELKYNTELATMITEQLRSQGYNVDIYNRGYAKVENVSELNRKKYDIFLSLHCNGATGTATGTEMLYWVTSFKSKRLASLLQEETLKSLGLRDRGIKSKTFGDRGAYLLRTTNAPCVILEPFFIDTDSDIEIGKSKKVEYSNGIVNAINKYFNF